MTVGRGRVLTLVVLCALVAAAPATAQVPPDPVIADGVTVSGVDVAGLTAAEATAAVQEFFARPVGLAVGTEKSFVRASRLGARARIPEAIAAALAAPADTALPLRVVVSRLRAASLGQPQGEGLSPPTRLGSYRARPLGAAHRRRSPRARTRQERVEDAAPFRAPGAPPLGAACRALAPALDHAEEGGPGDRHPPWLPAPHPVPRHEAREDACRHLLPGGRRHAGLPDPGRELRDPHDEAEPVVVTAELATGPRARNRSAGPGNPLGTRWMGVGGGVGIHGTYNSGSIGSAASHGCIRMRISSRSGSSSACGSGRRSTSWPRSTRVDLAAVPWRAARS